MMSTATQTTRLLQLKTPLEEDVLLLDRMMVTEQLSRPFSIALDLMAELSQASSVKADQLIGKAMTVTIELPDEKTRCFHGVVSQFAEMEADSRFAYYKVELASWIWLLSLKSNCRVFQDLSVLEIIKKIFDELKSDFSDLVDYRVDTKTTYTKLDYCVQYRETDFNFVSRLMEQEGIFFFFEHKNDKHTLVLADSPDAIQPCPNQPEARYAPEAGPGDGEDYVMSWESRRAMVPGKYVLRDSQFQMPPKDLEVSKQSKVKIGDNSKLELFDYPGEYAQRFNKPDERMGKVEKEGSQLAKWRIEEHEVPHLVISGSSTCRDFSTGFRFGLTGADGRSIVVPDTEGQYIITSITHMVEQSPDYVSGGSNSEPYQNSFSCIPHEVPYRPARITPKPVVQGIQSAVVVGPSGEEIHTDKYGRVRVQFPWDRKGEKDDHSSCWVRVSQSMAGTQWGAHFWPRIGHEVLVAFMEGDPDHPIIVGSVYNADNMPPYDLPENQTRSGIKTRSSKDGSNKNFNEIRFEDKKGKEEIYFHAEKNFNRVVENNDTLKVGFDTSNDGDQTIEIHNNQDVTIGNAEAKDGSQTVEIWKDQKHTLKQGNREALIEMGKDELTIKMGDQKTAIKMGNQSTKLDIGKSSTEAMQSIELKVGGSSIKIDQMGVTIKGMMVKIEATTLAEMKGTMTTVEGSAMLTAKGGITMIN